MKNFLCEYTVVVSRAFKTMKYAVFILAVVAVQGIRCQNCTRTNRQSNFCSKPCDPARNDCKGNRDCVCDGNCGYSCVKRDLRCPTLTFSNGRVRYKDNKFGSVARYRCTPPKTAVGSKKRTCRGNGNWDGNEPICKLICIDPGDIPHGTKKHDGLELGKKVKYSCLPGFTMQGSSTLTCTRTGAWDRVTPSCTCKRTNPQPFRYCRKSCNPDSGSCSRDRECVCDGDCGYSCVPKAIDCGRPSVLENGEREYSSTTFGSTVSYQCDKPYTLLGSKIRTCRGIRRWDGTEPSCKIICQDPGDIANGNKQIYRRNYDEDYVAVGDRAEYTCFPGYKMEGSKYLTCTNSGEWNQDKPKCKLPSCDRPKLPDNSELRGPKKASYKYSDKVFLRCKTGYFTRRTGLLTCGSDGWNGPSFSCSPKSCGNPGIPTNGKLKSYIFTFKSKVAFDCNDGYKLVGDKYLQCQANQRWSGRPPTCKPIDCGVLPTPDKAEKILETHTRVGGVVRFQCNEKGYEINGSEIRTCQKDESWSGLPTSCKIISCGNPGNPVNGKQVNVKNGYNYGGSVQFACKDTYTLSGRSKIYCEETKDWSAPIPKCWAPCPHPGKPVHGRRMGDDFRHTKSVTFKCKDDYELKGKATIRCNDGRWSDDIPKCTAPCPDPGVPGNGSRMGDDFRHGKRVTFKCDDDYEIEGSATVSCNYGTWTDNLPQCKVISCADPGSPEHGRQAKVSTNFAVHGFVRFKCDVNYTLIGKSELTCQRNEKWNGEIPKCLAPCPDPGHPINGKTVGSVFLHDRLVKFECLGDRFLDGSSEAKCNNGQWDATLPMCRDCNKGFPLGMASRKIPDDSITASSQKDQFSLAHYGRLGQNRYWCSNEEKNSFIQIQLPKKYKITEARIQLQDEYKIKQIVLKGEILDDWKVFHREKPPYSTGVEVEKIIPPLPFVAQSLRISVLRKKRTGESICLRAEVYGCEIPRDCILQGSAVLIQHSSGYRKGYVGGILFGWLEVWQPGKVESEPMEVADVILDQKPNTHELAIGTLVLGKDVNLPGLIKKGKIEQIGDSSCTIKSNDETWNSNLNDVRVVKKSSLCPS